MVYVSTINTLGVGTRDRLADEEWVAGPNVPCPYVMSKQAAERSVREQIERGLDACIVHPGLMFGPWDWKPSSGRMLIEVVQRFTPLAPAGGISVCDVRDVAQGIVDGPRRGPDRPRFRAGRSQSNLPEVVAALRRYCRWQPPPVPQRTAHAHGRRSSGRLMGPHHGTRTGRQFGRGEALRSVSLLQQCSRSTGTGVPDTASRRIHPRRVAMVPRVRLRVI